MLLAVDDTDEVEDTDETDEVEDKDETEDSDDVNEDELLITTALDKLELAALLAGAGALLFEPPPQATRPKKLILETRLSALTLRPRLMRWKLYMGEAPLLLLLPVEGSIKFLLCSAIPAATQGELLRVNPSLPAQLLTQHAHGTLS